MIAALGLLTGPAGKALGILVALIALAGGIAAIRGEIVAAALARANAATLTTELAIERANNARIVAALQNQADAAAAIAQRTGEAHAATHAVPTGTACARSPAVRAARGALRGTRAGGGAAAAPGGAAGPAGLRTGP